MPKFFTLLCNTGILFLNLHFFLQLLELPSVGAQTAIQWRLRPPVHFTQATEQSEDGNNSGSLVTWTGFNSLTWRGKALYSITNPLSYPAP